MRTRDMRIPAAVVLAALVLGACGGGDEGDTTGGGAQAPPPDAGPAYVEEVAVGVDGDSVTVTISGDLPTPCDAVQTSITAAREIEGGTEGARRVDVEVWSERQTDDDEACAQVLQPFETSVSTPIPEGVEVEVYVNDELAGRVTR